MGTLIKNNIRVFAKDVWFTKDMLYVQLSDGRELGVPITWFSKLKNATKDQLKKWRFIGNGIGIHWEDLDEDISIEALL